MPSPAQAQHVRRGGAGRSVMHDSPGTQPHAQPVGGTIVSTVAAKRLSAASGVSLGRLSFALAHKLTTPRQQGCKAKPLGVTQGWRGVYGSRDVVGEAFGAQIAPSLDQFGIVSSSGACQ